MNWPKHPTSWIEDRTLYVSVPFTWDLTGVRRQLGQRSFFYDRAVVGGPAVQLMPEFFSGLPHVAIGQDMPGVLQRANPMATRTTTGCVNKCGFCAIGRGLVEPGGFQELDDWPDLPVLCDNNLLAASPEHFDRVMDRLERWGWCDFNQGIDARLLTDHHAERFARIKEPVLRLALDSMSYADQWQDAYDCLRRAKIAKRKIRSYVLVAFTTGPDEAWERCEWVEEHGVLALPMWFHPLDALEKNKVTNRQEDLGWNDYERRKIMQWFYKHKKAVV